MRVMFTFCRRTFDQRFVVVFCAAILTAGLLLYGTDTFGSWLGIEPASNAFRLNFIPEKYRLCEDLVRNSSVYGIQLSEMNRLKSREFEEVVRNVTGGKGVEGHSGQVEGEYLIMHHLAGQTAARVICETGFNLGHSSFNSLTANDKSIVHSFDLGNHDYAHKMSDYLKKLFPTRFFIHFGDSTKTIPEFSRNNPDFRCDLMFVDGGHVYPVALADIKNFAKMANLEENVMAFDDYPTDWGKGFGKAWDDAIKEGILKEFMRCTFLHFIGLQRGFTIGRVLKRPAEDGITTSKP